MAVKFSPLSAGWILVLVYAVGLAGFFFPQTNAIMNQLVWVNLLFTLIILLLFHKKWNQVFVASIFLIACIGFLLEVVGVKTGYIFGFYQYGPTLGYSYWDTPLMMMVTWVTTIYTTRQVAEMVSKEPFLTSSLAALMMVFLDFFIEPFAIRHQLWTWNSIEVPLHNYIGWFVSGLIIQYCFIKSVKFSVNKLSLPVYLIQLAFFIALFLLKK